MRSLCKITIFGFLVGAVQLPATPLKLDVTYTGYVGGTVNMKVGSAAWKTVGGGIFSFERTGGDYNVGPAIGEEFFAICIEPLEYVQTGIRTWDIDELPVGSTTHGAFAAARLNLMLELFGRYWPVFETPLALRRDAFSLQLAIWELAEEMPGNSLDVLSGHIMFKNEASAVAGALAQANMWLASLDGTGPKAQGLHTMLNRGLQDFAFQVTTVPPQEIPEPTHLLGGGLLLLLGLKRRLG